MKIDTGDEGWSPYPQRSHFIPASGAVPQAAVQTSKLVPSRILGRLYGRWPQDRPQQGRNFQNPTDVCRYERIPYFTLLLTRLGVQAKCEGLSD